MDDGEKRQKRKIGEAKAAETDVVATSKIKQNDSLAEAATVFKNARINKVSLADQSQNNRTDAGTKAPDANSLVPTVLSLDDAYRIQVGTYY